MTTRPLLLLVLLFTPALACAPAPPAPAQAPQPSPPSHAAPEPPPPFHGPRLRASDQDLFVTAAPDSYPRGAILYVLDARPLHGTTRLRIGLVQVVEPKPVRVAWYCRPRRPIDAVLRGEGLPVEPFTPDTTLRAGKCWGRYRNADGSSWQDRPAVVDLTLNLGEGDAVRPGDLFELLGEPIADTDNRAIVGFERLGQCAAQPFEGSVSTSACRLDLTSWPRFDRDAWLRGGFIHLVQEAAPSAR